MRASQVALGKNPPCDAGDGFMGSVPGWEDLLEESIATHFSILAWGIAWTEAPGRLWSVGSHKSLM